MQVRETFFKKILWFTSHRILKWIYYTIYIKKFALVFSAINHTIPRYFSLHPHDLDYLFYWETDDFYRVIALVNTIHWWTLFLVLVYCTNHFTSLRTRILWTTLHLNSDSISRLWCVNNNRKAVNYHKWWKPYGIQK